jgi:endonuclease G
MEKGMGNNYDRGHQVASADRLASYDMNSQTFYYTNMTAQVGAGMNQDIWNNLENKIRNEYTCRDTLYVVTGCVMTTEEDTQVQWVNNRNGGKVAVPKAYFKVLLRTKSGNTGKAVDNSNATTIGFWYENRRYSYSTPRVSDVKSVDEIERLTGFTFFPQISDQIKEQKDLARWGF